MKYSMLLTHILPVESGVNREGKTWRKQGFVFEDPNVKYPNIVYATIFGEDTLSRFNFKVGDLVNVEFFHQAHEYNGRWFNEIRVRDFEPVTSVSAEEVKPFAY